MKIKTINKAKLNKIEKANNVKLEGVKFVKKYLGELTIVGEQNGKILVHCPEQSFGSPCIFDFEVSQVLDQISRKYLFVYPTRISNDITGGKIKNASFKAFDDECMFTGEVAKKDIEAIESEYDLRAFLYTPAIENAGDNIYELI